MEPIEQNRFVENENLDTEYGEDSGMPLFELALRGRQKINNSMAASISNQVMGIRNATIRNSLTSISGASHRLEYVAAIRGVVYINDSKSTNINSVWFSLESMESKVVLILCGDAKETEYQVIKDLVQEKVKAIVCLGKDNAGIHESFSEDVDVLVDVETIENAVKTSYMLAEKGEVVLFSPSCSSFGQFKNFEDRGNQFTEAVRKL